MSTSRQQECELSRDNEIWKLITGLDTLIGKVDPFDIEITSALHRLAVLYSPRSGREGHHPRYLTCNILFTEKLRHQSDTSNEYAGELPSCFQCLVKEKFDLELNSVVEKINSHIVRRLLIDCRVDTSSLSGTYLRALSYCLPECGVYFINHYPDNEHAIIDKDRAFTWCLDTDTISIIMINDRTIGKR